MDGSPGPASPRPEPPPGGSGPLNFWTVVSVIVFSLGALATAYCDVEQTLAVGIITTLCGVGLMGISIWEAVKLSDEERRGR